MSFYDAIRIGASGVAADYEIARSIRFNGQYETNAQQFRRTGTSTVSTYTISMWAKNCGVGTGVYRMLFSIGQENDANAGWVGITDSDLMGFQGGNSTYSTTTRVFRDPSAWFHFLISVNSNNFTVYINGTSIKTGTIRSLDTSTNGIRIGINYGSFYPWDGYIADYYLIDGQALTPSSFTETNTLTGQLIPKLYTGSFGTEGAHLTFEDNSGVTATTIGKDSSGNGNNYTPSGDWSVSAGAGNDSSEDSPTNNFATINPLAGYSSTFEVPTNGNLDFSLANSEFAFSSFVIPTSGKWYAEILFTTHASGRCGITNLATKNANKWHGIDNLGSEIRVDDSAVQTGLSPAIGDNKIVGIKVDRDAGTIAFTVDGSAAGTAVNLSSMSNPDNLVFAVGRNSSSGSAPAGSFNFGQRTFSHLPSGYKGLNSQNLPDPIIKLPNKYFDTKTYAGTGDQRSIGGFDFAPDWVWIKRMNANNSHILANTLTGAGNYLVSNSSDAESSGGSQLINAFNDDGFDVGTDNAVNASGGTYVAWNWNAGGSTATNTDGTISAQVRANTTAGFSIITYTGNGSSATIGHGLGVAPKMIISKRRNSTQDWVVNPGEITGTRGTKLKLNTVDSVSTDTGVYPNTATTSSVYSVGSANEINGNNNTYIAYVFSEVAGYSKFGSYDGNGSNNGTFVHCGFRPAFVLIKMITANEDWPMYDNKRDPFNVGDHRIFANTNGAEGAVGQEHIDFVSNGFKFRKDKNPFNSGSSATYIYFAFAEAPFKNSRAR